MTAASSSRRQALRAGLGWTFSAAAGLLSAPATRAQTEIRLGGSGSALGTMQWIGAAFMEEHPALRVTVAPAVGSPGGVNALAAGRLEVALSTRETDAHAPPASRHLVQEYARTPLAIVVHKNAGISALSSAELAALYEPGATFANGQRARPVIRPEHSTEARILRSISPSLAAALDAAASRRGMLEAATDSEAADMVQQTPGAFAAITLAQMTSERRPFTALALDGREPSLEAMAKGSYPYFKRQFAIVARVPSDPVALFLAFLRGPKAHAILRANGSLPA
jgi:phosphate transport system substrate-binding protein